MARTQVEVFSDNLNQIMQDKKLSMSELSRRLGCSIPTVFAWCHGQTMPRKELMEKLCKALNVQRDELVMDRATIPNLSIPAAHPVPILGLICAGNGVDAEENFDGYFFVDNSIRADYCLRVEGDSMKDANINHGDIAFLRKSYDFINGGIYAVVFGDDRIAVLKKVYRQGDNLLLMPCNQKYEPISISANEVQNCGECIGIYSPRSN